MKLKDSTIFITGANRGLGLEFARQALAGGARKVYAGARDPSQVTLPGVIPVALDVNDPAQVAAAAAACGDVTLVINNAGIANPKGLLAEDSIDAMQRMLDTNLFGVLRVSQAFAPVLAANGGGALLNVLSVASWVSAPVLAGYSVSKAAAWSLTNGLRNELREQRTQVLGLHVGFIDTDLTQGFDAPKLAPGFVVQRTFEALEAGASEVMVGDLTQAVKRGLSDEPGVYIDQVR
ncbi:SDR family oxidoreductase [Telluria aromaticivorans]|uniref:SDR family oxidoreductase n=1 Tax=Telluria aromaticivorans TaxID=2725995 RepID=A0A7Y2JYX8_9BURK|nr:SDR family oxidoreductase [Telluria aromaticivorans]NNG22968.1 SDR family oxidoreductase [Telluria aromaticivorans]